MARTLVDAAGPRTPAHTPPVVSTDEKPSVSAAGPRTAPKAYELTDPQGHRAYLWRADGKWTVETDNAGFRRRILRGLKRPIWSVEYERDEAGERWCMREEIQP